MNPCAATVAAAASTTEPSGIPAISLIALAFQAFCAIYCLWIAWRMR